MNELTIATVVGLISTALNLWLTFRIKTVQVNKELITSQREEIEELKETIRDLHKKKGEYKHNYQQLLIHTNKIEGELTTYKKLHSHE